MPVRKPYRQSLARSRRELEGGDMRILVLTALCILSGCGTAPPRAVDASPAATPQTAESGAELKAAVASDRKAEFKPPMGYKAKIVGWDILYCRKMVILGSRFPKEVCMTEAQLKEHMITNDEMRRDVDKATRTCSTAGACGGI
jgi:hypothetical protein